MCEDTEQLFQDIKELKECCQTSQKDNKEFLESIDKSLKNQNLMLSIVFQSLDSNFAIKLKQAGVEL